MSRSYPTTYPILLLRKTARRGTGIPRRALQRRDGRIRTGDPLNPIQVRYRTAPRPETFSCFTSLTGRG